jgi:hypothetical protein
MFNRFVNATRSIFYFRAERQLELPDRSSTQERSQIPQAPGEMVTTRSQADRPELVNGLEDSGLKRKRSREADESPAARKKRTAVEPEIVTSSQANESKSLGKTPKNDRREKIPELPLRPHGSSDSVDAAAEVVLPSTLQPQEVPKHESSSKAKKESDQSSKNLGAGSQVDEVEATNPGADNNTEFQRAKHVRFDSEEPQSPLNGLESKLDDVSQMKEYERDAHIPGDSSSDDDEAPDTVTAAQSQEKARASAAGVSKAIQR